MTMVISTSAGKTKKIELHRSLFFLSVEAFSWMGCGGITIFLVERPFICYNGEHAAKHYSCQMLTFIISPLQVQTWALKWWWMKAWTGSWLCGEKFTELTRTWKTCADTAAKMGLKHGLAELDNCIITGVLDLDTGMIFHRHLTQTNSCVALQICRDSSLWNKTTICLLHKPAKQWCKS